MLVWLSSPTLRHVLNMSIYGNNRCSSGLALQPLPTGFLACLHLHEAVSPGIHFYPAKSSRGIALRPSIHNPIYICPEHAFACPIERQKRYVYAGEKTDLYMPPARKAIEYPHLFVSGHPDEVLKWLVRRAAGDHDSEIALAASTGRLYDFYYVIFTFFSRNEEEKMAFYYVITGLLNRCFPWDSGYKIQVEVKRPLMINYHIWT
jgi:hypothetical protein